jgi:hypothetical protein
MNVAEIITTSAIAPGASASAQVSHIRWFFGPYYWDPILTGYSPPSCRHGETSLSDQLGVPLTGRVNAVDCGPTL